MTREEAIRWIEQIKHYDIDADICCDIEKRYEALDMAIEALENTEYIINLQKTYQRFIDMWGKLYEEDNLVRCKDCKWYKPIYKDKEYDCPQGLCGVYENDYCSCGERREQCD